MSSMRHSVFSVCAAHSHDERGIYCIVYTECEGGAALFAFSCLSILLTASFGAFFHISRMPFVIVLMIVLMMRMIVLMIVLMMMFMMMFMFIAPIF